MLSSRTPPLVRSLPLRVLPAIHSSRLLPPASDDAVQLSRQAYSFLSSAETKAGWHGIYS